LRRGNVGGALARGELFVRVVVFTDGMQVAWVTLRNE
jgi:hypothetical protein